MFECYLCVRMGHPVTTKEPAVKENDIHTLCNGLFVITGSHLTPLFDIDTKCLSFLFCL